MAAVASSSTPRISVGIKKRPELSPYFLSALKLDQPVAKVGSNELKTDELRDYLLLTFQGQMTQVTLSKPDLVAKISVGLDQFINEELLAQAALKEGLKSSFEGVERKQDLAKKYLESQLAKEPPVSDDQMREFYKRHGEKFLIPAGVQLREFFIPLTGEKSKTSKNDSAFDLAKELAERVTKGDAIEELSKKYVPEEYRERTQIHLYKGGVTEPVDDQKGACAPTGSKSPGPFVLKEGIPFFKGSPRNEVGLFRFTMPRLRFNYFSKPVASKF